MSGDSECLSKKLAVVLLWLVSLILLKRIILQCCVNNPRKCFIKLPMKEATPWKINIYCKLASKIQRACPEIFNWGSGWKPMLVCFLSMADFVNFASSKQESRRLIPASLTVNDLYHWGALLNACRGIQCSPHKSTFESYHPKYIFHIWWKPYHPFLHDITRLRKEKPNFMFQGGEKKHQQDPWHALKGTLLEQWVCG